MKNAVTYNWYYNNNVCVWGGREGGGEGIMWHSLLKIVSFLYFNVIVQVLPSACEYLLKSTK